MKLFDLNRLRSQNKGKQSTEQDFMNDVLALSKFMGYHIDIKQVTMMEYCSMIRLLEQHNQQIQMKNEKIKNKVS
jgi:hypothetical protein